VYGRVGRIEGWRSGGALHACRRGGVCLKKSEALEMRCSRRDIEVWRSGALEECCVCGDVDEFASRPLEMRCRRVDVEM